MKSRTVTVYEGERTGDIDWAYNFEQHTWGPDKGGLNPQCTEDAKSLLEAMEKHYRLGKNVEANQSHSDRYCRVIDIGMYDGWPHWTPVPSYCVLTYFGAEWHPFYSLNGWRLAP